MKARNPWLDVPAQDYIGHMASEAVGQLPVLADLFGRALRRAAPGRLLVLGCGTGNGFDRIDPRVTRAVTGVEINPAYLDLARQAHPDPPFELALVCGDAQDFRIPEGSFDLIFAALLFEYISWEPLVSRVAAGLAPGGCASVVLQLPSPSTPAVSPTPFVGVRVLESLFRFVEPERLRDAFVRAGLEAGGENTVPLPQGKAFAELWFRKG